MQIAVQADAVAVLAATAVTLFLKGVALSYLQVRLRVINRTFKRPEDARLMRVTAQPEPEIVDRIADAWRNEHENTPPFLAMAVGFILLGGDSWPLLVLSSLFCAARFAQAYAQITVRQPHRTIAFLVGLAASIGLAMLTIVRMWAALQ